MKRLSSKSEVERADKLDHYHGGLYAPDCPACIVLAQRDRLAVALRGLMAAEGGEPDKRAEEPQRAAWRVASAALEGLPVVDVTSARLRKIGRFTYEVQAAGFDFHVRKERGQWIADAFDSAEQDAAKAHRSSAAYDTLHEALTAIFQGRP